MTLWYWRYALVPRRRLSAVAADGPRQGALIRAGDGFADVHPWPELGDLPLDAQLSMLARGETTPLTRRSLAFATADGEARRSGRSLFQDLAIPASHWTGEDPPPDFDTVKVKCGPRFDPASLGRFEGLRLRLDFNATLTAEEFRAVAPALPKGQLDFVEDPCPYDAGIWRELRRDTGIPLAIDRGEGEADVRVIKPAIQEFAAAGRVVITSYMDHAIGQFAAAWVAAAHRDEVDPRCGLFTHVLFEPDPFFERVRSDGAVLLPPHGTGFGFDDLLEGLPWRKLA